MGATGAIYAVTWRWYGGSLDLDTGAAWRSDGPGDAGAAVHVLVIAVAL